MKTIAVLGLGRMGHAMASRFLDGGYHVIAWNRSPEKATDLVHRGATWAPTPAAAASKATIVFSMMADDDASHAVWMGPEGAFNTLKPGSFVIECSTLSAAHVAHLSAVAKQKNFIYIDCPVTGLPEVAAAGKLTLLIGAEPDDLARIKPVLECISATIRYFGGVGTGTAYKLIINLMGAVQIAALAEALALAGRLSLHKEAVIQAIENSAAASPQVVRHARKMAEQNFAAHPSFTTSLRYKDALYALALAKEMGAAIPLGDVAANWFGEAAKANPNEDEAAVIKRMM